jgi:hypothetical protein
MVRVPLFHELQILAINPVCTIFVRVAQVPFRSLKVKEEEAHVLSMFLLRFHLLRTPSPAASNRCRSKRRIAHRAGAAEPTEKLKPPTQFSANTRAVLCCDFASSG